MRTLVTNVPPCDSRTTGSDATFPTRITLLTIAVTPFLANWDERRRRTAARQSSLLRSGGQPLAWVDRPSVDLDSGVEMPSCRAPTRADGADDLIWLHRLPR